MVELLCRRDIRQRTPFHCHSGRSLRTAGLLAGIVFADLVGVQDPRERRKRIITAVEGRSIATPRLERLFENVPPRDLNFTGRDNRLSELHKLLMDTDRPAAITQAAIHGLGGIGKTSLAAEYVHRYAGAYAGVWWAPAEQRTVRQLPRSPVGWTRGSRTNRIRKRRRGWASLISPPTPGCRSSSSTTTWRRRRCWMASCRQPVCGCW